VDKPAFDWGITDSVAIVTGAGRGLGRAMAFALADAGASVVVAARREEDLAAVVAEITGRGGTAVAVVTDVCDSDACEFLVDQTVEKFGRLDILVNNAGAVADLPFLQTPDAVWEQIFQTNVGGAVRCTRAAGSVMTAAGRGKVINIVSNFALMGVPGYSAYAASKGALVSLTKTLAIEWARHGVQVNGIAPGHFATDLNAEAFADPAIGPKVLRSIPARRVGAPEELGPLVCYLASQASDFMTGETIVIDGGLSSRR